MSKWRYYEGTTSANTILNDLSKVMCMAVKDNNGKVIQDRNWDIVFPAVDTNPVQGDYLAPVDRRNLTDEEYAYKIKNQLRQVKNKVILKTTTTPVNVEGDAIDDLEIESDLNKKQISMYVELYKPSYLLDPERFEPETEKFGLLPLLKTFDLSNLNPDDTFPTPYVEKLIRNNHHVYVRAFDSIETVYDPSNRTKVVDVRPKEEIKDEYTGNILETSSHISEWAKLAWYKDFEEVERDIHDGDIGGENIADGLDFMPTNTPGINGNTRLRFWINTNNDRVVMTLMGNPSLEYSSNKFLTSVCYLGRIQSFDNSINDTAGNFAITASSSTIPSKTVQKIKSTRVTNFLDAESQIKYLSDGVTPAIGAGDGQKNRFFIPFKYSYKEDSIKVYLNDVEVNKNFYRIDNDLIEFTRMVPGTGEVVSVRAEFIIPDIDLSQGVTRDELGNVVEVVQPNKYGQNTGTCVTDIAMYHTRSKAYWQKHGVMFNTTEEYMTKEMYGKSAYTDEYYADKLKITHGNDGPRGMLDACLVIDQSSLIPLDDLVINRDFKNDASKPEETYIYFPITAPYSVFSSGPNALSGVAILKEIKLPEPQTATEAINRVESDLYIGKISAVLSDFTLPLTGDYDSTISWVSSNPAIIDVSTTPGTATVTRPGETDPEAKVTLTATITKDGETKDVVFECTVFPEGMSDVQAVAQDKAWINLSSLNGGIDLEKFRDASIVVPVEGPNETTIEWVSSDTDVISNPVSI